MSHGDANSGGCKKGGSTLAAEVGADTSLHRHLLEGVRLQTFKLRAMQTRLITRAHQEKCPGDALGCQSNKG